MRNDDLYEGECFRTDEQAPTRLSIRTTRETRRANRAL